ncbi:MAG TPA: hypothetical protein VFN03_06705 [Trueperaceae bacterium]|nr:hypothetical protein [Trueperaceae bacterium]
MRGLALAALALLSCAFAQNHEADLQRAVDVVSRHPVFAIGLAEHPGWTATGYDSQGRYGVWRVDIAAYDGEPLGWAQVRLSDERVYAWDAFFGLEGEAYDEAQAAIIEFLRYDPEFLDFAGDVDDNDWTWIGYEDWRDTWTIYLERGVDSLQVILRSEHAWQRSLEDLHILQIEVPFVVAVDDWQAMQGAEAIALAFSDAGIAAAVRGLDGWTTEVTELDRALWLVTFWWEGTSVARAEVDLDRQLVDVAR